MHTHTHTHRGIHVDMDTKCLPLCKRGYMAFLYFLNVTYCLYYYKNYITICLVKLELFNIQ
jgi:hypothetical protein